MRILELHKFKDHRGVLSKLKNFSYLCDYQETLCVVNSQRGVLRGMHRQKGLWKVITCIQGSILDVAYCPEANSFESQVISGDQNKALLISKNEAHGYQTLEDNTIVVYHMFGPPYDPSEEEVFNYNSFGFDWPIKDVIISEKDKNA